MQVNQSQSADGQRGDVLFSTTTWSQTCDTIEDTLHVFERVTRDASRLPGGERMTAWLEQQTRRAQARLLRLRALPRQVHPVTQLVEPSSPEPAPARANPAPDTPHLTAREREVAILIARGLSNRQIAEKLVVVQGTAANHVAHILHKLDCANRAQVAAWAVQTGLLPPPG